MYRAELVDRGFYWRKRTLHDKSLVLYLPFDKDDGPYAKDRSGYNNHGNIYGAVKVAGKVGDALSFDGVDDYVGIPYSATLTPSAITISVWYLGIDWDPYYSHRNELVASFDGTYGFLFASGAGVPYFKFSTSAGALYILSSVVIGKNEWHHLAGVASPPDMYLYLDGRLVAERHDLGTLIYPPQRKTTIGQDSRGMWFWNGFIDEVRIYNRGLSQTEVVRVMNMRGI
jgi:hypothetical protein